MEKYFRKPWSSSALILAAPIHRGLTSPVPGTNVKIMKYTIYYYNYSLEWEYNYKTYFYLANYRLFRNWINGTISSFSYSHYLRNDTSVGDRPCWLIIIRGMEYSWTWRSTPNLKIIIYQYHLRDFLREWGASDRYILI